MPVVFMLCMLNSFVCLFEFRSFWSIRIIAGPGGVIEPHPKAKIRWVNHWQKKTSQNGRIFYASISYIALYQLTAHSVLLVYNYILAVSVVSAQSLFTLFFLTCLYVPPGRGGSEGSRVPQLVERLQDCRVVRAASGAQFTAALTDSGAVYTWGKGDTFRLGHGTEEHARYPLRVEALAGG